MANPLVNIGPLIRQQFSENGIPLQGGKLFSYAAGTTNKLATYTDSSGGVANTNPIILDFNGQCDLFLDVTKTYKFVLSPPTDTDPPTGPYWVRDNIPGGLVAGAIVVDGVSLATYFMNSVNVVVGSISALRAVSKAQNVVAFVTGYYNPHDGGGGPYQLDPNDLTSTDNGFTIIVATDGGRWKLQYTSTLSVKQAGAKGDGSTDDTTSIQMADTVARALGVQLYFPGSVYMVSQLTVYTGSNWRGDGRAASIVTQKIGSNTDLIYGNNSNANWGSSSPTLIVNGWQIRGMQFNGNYNSGTGNTTGSGMAVYGARPIMEDVFFTNCAEHGMRTEYTDTTAGGLDTFTMEGHFVNVRIDTVGKHGWWNNGPNDSVAINIICIDAGQSATNTYDGFHYDAKSTGRNIGNHSWTRGASLRMQYALNLQPGAQHEFAGGCNFEGAYSACVGIFTSNCLFDSTTRYYAAWNGVTIFMGKTATLNTINGWCGGPGAGRPATIGIYLGSVAGDFIGNNNINLAMESQEAGNIQFTSFDGGNNIIRINAFNTSAASYGGTPATTDDFELRLQNSGGTSVISNRHQKTSLAIGGSASATWTFPFGFNGNPVISGAPIGAASGGWWITALSSTAVTIFNNTGTGITMSLNADAVN